LSFDQEKRLIRRAELGYKEGDIVFVYSGGMAQYQMIAEMLVLWREIFALNSSIKFLLMINSDPPSLEHSVGSLADFRDRLKILNLNRAEVYSTLSSADIGFLLRENRPLNANASPVKFAEYLAAGLAVISSPGIGDLSSKIVNQKLGALLKPSKEAPEVGALIEFIQVFAANRITFRNRALAVARQEYNWDVYEDTYNKLYSSL
jgi:glycosyltransferase involved in cell wall biosynthesis